MSNEYESFQKALRQESIIFERSLADKHLKSLKGEHSKFRWFAEKRAFEEAQQIKKIAFENIRK